MIELLYMTYFMDDDIVAHFRREEDQFVVEVEVPLLGA